MYTCILLICCTICTTSAEKTFIQLGRQFSWFSIQNLVCLFLNFQNSSIHVSSFLLSTLVTTKCMCQGPPGLWWLYSPSCYRPSSWLSSCPRSHYCRLLWSLHPHDWYIAIFAGMLDKFSLICEYWGTCVHYLWSKKYIYKKSSRLGSKMSFSSLK